MCPCSALLVLTLHLVYYKIPNKSSCELWWSPWNNFGLFHLLWLKVTHKLSSLHSWNMSRAFSYHIIQDCVCCLPTVCKAFIHCRDLSQGRGGRHVYNLHISFLLDITFIFSWGFAWLSYAILRYFFFSNLRTITKIWWFECRIPDHMGPYKTIWIHTRP